MAGGNKSGEPPVFLRPSLGGCRIGGRSFGGGEPVTFSMEKSSC